MNREIFFAHLLSRPIWAERQNVLPEILGNRECFFGSQRPLLLCPIAFRQVPDDGPITVQVGSDVRWFHGFMITRVYPKARIRAILRPGTNDTRATLQRKAQPLLEERLQAA